MTRCESYPPCFGTIYFPTAPYVLYFIIWTCGEIVKQNVTMHI